MSILSLIAGLATGKRLKQIEKFRRDPAGVQEALLKNLVTRAAETEWGTSHGYSSIRTVEQFRERVPIQKYEDIMPYVERLWNGEKDILWPGEVRWFAKSSGTTGARSKFIPVTKESLVENHYRGGKDVLAIYLNNRPGSAIFKGSGLILGGSHKINNFSNKSLYGDLSAILIENAPWWFDLIRTPSRKTALIEDFEKKLNLIAEITVKENVTSLSGAPSWFLVLI